MISRSVERTGQCAQIDGSKQSEAVEAVEAETIEENDMPTCHLCGSPWFDAAPGGRIECCDCGAEFKQELDGPLESH